MDLAFIVKPKLEQLNVFEEKWQMPRSGERVNLNIVGHIAKDYETGGKDWNFIKPCEFMGTVAANVIRSDVYSSSMFRCNLWIELSVRKN